MFKLFINNVQIGNYETIDDLNKSLGAVFAYDEITDMKLVDEGGAISVKLTQKN
jgi:hypothetical protein